MAILILITELQETSVNMIDDVVGVFEDDHPFSVNELNRFNFLTVTGSREDVQNRLNQARPKTYPAFHSFSTGEYTFTEPVDKDGVIKVWSTLVPPVRWYQLNNDDKFLFKVGDLTQTERDFISAPEFDINSPLVDHYIDKFVKNLGRKPENNIEITELRGLEL